MKRLLFVPVCLLLALNLSSCLSPEERHRRDEEFAREDARDDALRARRFRAGYDAFLEDYASRLGKSRDELTPRERAEARREWEEGGPGPGYRPWYW